ncbi:unnamed protein product [Bursaphelenchus okinawaensis]|uniref:SET domain-containing protein n=1 Tax=Bursaphelenchus okinawaensis TaxID=465554 RepID=A0A811KW05_9BILA|nr:unnamed protein product [Bursaphelenchus okinawaensis]CAG9112508.1 unnamed protein product [Bursaphelenchus okinawaensis]
MNGSDTIEPVAVQVRQIVIDEDEPLHNIESPVKIVPHDDHDYGSASGARYNSALEYYGDGQNNETFPLLEGLGDKEFSSSPVKSEPRPQFIQQPHRPAAEHYANIKTVGFGSTNRVGGRTQVLMQSRPRSAYTIPQSFRIRPEATTPVLSYASSVSRIVRAPTGMETPVQRSTPNVLRQAVVRPRTPASVRPARPPKPIIQAPLSPESGLMNVLDEEDAQNQKFFSQHAKMGNNFTQMKPIVSSVASGSSLSISPQKQYLSPDSLNKARGRGRPSNAEKALQQQKNTSPDKNKLERLAEIAQQQATVSLPKPQMDVPSSEKSQPKPVLETVATENKKEAPPQHKLFKKLVASSPKKEEKVKAYESDKEEDEVEGVDYITRCLCDMKHNDEFMVQCDQCKAWVHVDCFGGEDVVDTESKFFCHKCDTSRINPLTLEEAKRLQLHKLAMLQKNRKKSKEKEKRTISPLPQKKHHKLIKKHVQKEKENTYSRSVRSDIGEGKISEGDLGTFVQLKSVGDRRCRNTLVGKGITGLMTTENVKKGEPLIEFKGHFCFVDEDKVHERLRDPKLFYHSVVYSGLGLNANPIFVDSSKSGTAANEARRSCRPNAKLSHCVIENRLVLFLVAAEDIDETSEVTLPFDNEERGNPPFQLDCACKTDYAYMSDEHKCLIEDYNRKVVKGEFDVRTEPISKKRTVSPEKPSSPKNVRKSPYKTEVRSPKPEVKTSKTAQVKSPRHEIRSPRREEPVQPKEASKEKVVLDSQPEEPSTSKEKFSEEEESEGTPRRSNRKRVSTNERLSPKPDAKLPKLTKPQSVDFDESVDNKGVVSLRVQKKIERLEQAEQKQGKRRKTSESDSSKISKGTRRSLAMKQASLAKKMKAESPEEAAASVLLGLSNADAGLSEKKKTQLLIYWKKCIKELETVGPFSTFDFSEIQKIASSKKKSTCLTNLESSKILTPSLQMLQKTSFDRSLPPPITQNAHCPVGSKIGQKTQQPAMDESCITDKKDNTEESIIKEGQSLDQEGDENEEKKPGDGKTSEGSTSESGSTSAPAPFVEQRVVTFFDAFKDVSDADISFGCETMVGRKFKHESPGKLTLDMLMSPRNLSRVDTPPKSAPPMFTPMSVSKSRLDTLKKQLFDGGSLAAVADTGASTPSARPIPHPEVFRSLRKPRTPPLPTDVEEASVTRKDRSSDQPKKKRLSEDQILAALNRLRKMTVFDRVKHQFFKDLN